MNKGFSGLKIHSVCVYSIVWVSMQSNGNNGVNAVTLFVHQHDSNEIKRFVCKNEIFRNFFVKL